MASTIICVLLLSAAIAGLVIAEHKGLYLLLLAFHAAQALGKENERGMKR